MNKEFNCIVDCEKMEIVQVGAEPVKIPWGSAVVFERGLVPAFHAALTIHKWYWPVFYFQFWSWGLNIFSPYATIRLVDES